METKAQDIRQGCLITRYYGWELFEYKGMYWVLDGSVIVSAYLRKSNAIDRMIEIERNA